MLDLKKWLFVIVIFSIIFVRGDLLFATHEVDHRYTIFGSVRDGSGRPVQDARVIVTDARLGDGLTAFTGKDGSFEATLHLHNENVGDEIVVSAQGEEKRIKASFDPSDKFSERRTKVDFGVEQAEKEKEWIYYGYGAGVILLAGMLFYMGIYKKRSGKEKKGGPGRRGKKGMKRIK
ncbi:MAG: carboxypeptidase-like regulatory domain-containing protein [Nitrospirota bacterium]